MQREFIMKEEKSSITKEIFLNRRKIYKNLDFPSIENTGLIFQMKASDSFYNIIQFLTEIYVKENLYGILKDKAIFDKKIQDIENEILQLPNITPGGIIHAKDESAFTYNLICKYFFLEFKKFFDHVELMSLPSIRFKSGKSFFQIDLIVQLRYIQMLGWVMIVMEFLAMEYGVRSILSD